MRIVATILSIGLIATAVVTESRAQNLTQSPALELLQYGGAQLSSQLLFSPGSSNRSNDPEVDAKQESHKTAERSPVVVELFTSQSCSSCVPANKYLLDLAKRDDVVALAWHVDYWNSLNTRDGRWEDPYSSAAFTERQRKYNLNIRERRSVYTPQMVVNGYYEEVGSDRNKINAMIKHSHKLMTKEPIKSSRVKGAKNILFQVGAHNTGNVYLVTFLKETDTEVLGGENAGVHFSDVNVVRKIDHIGSAEGQATSFEVTPREAGYGCALIIQTPGQGTITNAAYCP